MKPTVVNDMVIRFANVNGTGSASANELFAKSIFRMGIPVTPKNIFPSNIQGLPTWFEVRINGDGHLGRREGIDILVGVNPQSMKKDIASVRKGGFFIYDNSKELHDEYYREDIHFIGVPMIKMAIEHFETPRIQQLFKNIIYIGALCELLSVDTGIVKQIMEEKFAKKPKLIPPNIKALELGIHYIRENYKEDFPYQVSSLKRQKNNDKILLDGNTACALGAIYGGATVMAWYPITPSTSVAQNFEKYCKKWRIDKETGKKKYAFIQAEDELAAIGMVIGASWNGARAFTATSGAGVSLMNEFIGLAYFAEIPVVIINVQRGGPSTGMPTRTQQADITACAYASHGDTKHPMLLPSTPAECFEFTAHSFDYAARLQTVIFVMSDLDLGMNVHLSPPLRWEAGRAYDYGKVLDAESLEKFQDFGRYKEVDGDGIPYRTIPGTHPTKGAFFTRGTSHNEYARYSESGDDYVIKVIRLLKKWKTAKDILPSPEFYQSKKESDIGLIFYGSTTYAALEAMENIEAEGQIIDSMRLKSFPFCQEVVDFVNGHDVLILVEQNRDAQMRTLMINELDIDPKKILSILHYDGTPITADFITQKMHDYIEKISTVDKK